MKLRMGFVSNSSSASYLVKIHMNFGEVLTKFIENYDWWDIFDKDKVKARIQKWITDEKQYLTDREEVKSPLFSLYEHFKERSLDRIKNQEALLEDMDSDGYSKENLFFVALENNGIKFSTGKEIDTTELSYFTPMHNDFNEAIPELLKELILYFSFCNTKITYEIDRDEDDILR